MQRDEPLTVRTFGCAVRKKLGLFLSGMDASREQAYFTGNFTPDILQAALAKIFLGGAFHPEDAGFMERHIIDSLAKQAGSMSNISDDVRGDGERVVGGSQSHDTRH